MQQQQRTKRIHSLSKNLREALESKKKKRNKNFLAKKKLERAIIDIVLNIKRELKISLKFNEMLRLISTNL